jgi:AAA family ATP:ADP antiporter
VEGQNALTPQPYGGPLHAVLRRVVDVRAEEVGAVLMAFAYFFFVLSGWFMLRPIREAAGVAAGTSQLPWLFAGTLAAMLICNPLFSSLVVRYPVRRFIAITYHFFIANLLGFYVAMRIVSPAEGSVGDLWVGRAFFIWTSVFNLFVVSVFWCFMADYFRSEQAKRLFGFVAVGGTLGSIAGSGATAALASRIGTPNLLLASAVLLELAVLAVLRFPAKDLARADVAGAAEPQQLPIGGSIWAGVTHVVRSPYLLGISAFLVLLTMGSTVLYFEQADIVRRYFVDRASRTTVLAQVEFAVQTLTLATQVFLTGRIIRWVGLAAALAYLPLLSMVGFVALGLLPVFAAVAVFVVLRRAGNFALTNPAMEILFTVVPREDKYKAKSFIETFVYRGGDQAGAWSFAGLTALGLGLTSIAFVAVPMAGVMLALALWLGRRQGALAAEQAGATAVRT